MNRIFSSFAIGVTMQPQKKFLSLAWLALITLLVSPAVATEEAATTDVTAAPHGTSSISAEILAPRLSALERDLFDQIHDGRFGKFSLLQAGLIAGGVDSRNELQTYCKRFDQLVQSLRQSGDVRGTPRERAQAVLVFLHQTVLQGGYNLQASDLRQALDHGRFNCVTASLLFNCLAQRFGLKAVGLEIPGHAMSRLELPQETLDIETTCPRWFTRIEKRNGESVPPSGGPVPTEHEAAVRAELADRAPIRDAARGPQPLRQISEVELVATIYYNLGVDRLAEKRFADAAAANAKAVRLDPENATAKGNFLATINNWAIDLCRSGEYEKAAELLRLGLATDSRYEAFRSNYVQLFRQWSDHLCRSGRYDEAARLLARAAQEQPDEKFFHEAAIELLRRWGTK